MWTPAASPARFAPTPTMLYSPLPPAIVALMNPPDPNYLTSVNTWAQLASSNPNVISVGALGTPRPPCPILENASGLNIAPYSNRGPNLTLVAPTDSPATDRAGTVQIFNGTSAATPNLAAIASLVSSADINLTAGDVRDILNGTAMDLRAPGFDNTFGNGMVNADAAVPRHYAIAQNGPLATLYGRQRQANRRSRRPAAAYQSAACARIHPQPNAQRGR